MNTRYTTVNLDVSQQGSIPSITLSQYDLGVGLGFYIMDGGLPYSEFAETDTVVLSGTKPSGVGFTVPAYYKSGNLCSFRTPQAMTTEAGTVTCEITITKVNNISVSTANFFVEVEASAHAHETVDEDIEDFSLIANQVGEYKAVAVRAAQQAAQSATDAAASASSAEESMEAAQSAASSAIAAKDDIQEYIDDSEAWARGTRGGTEVPNTDETYHNNAKYYAEQSSQASMDAGSSASEAAASATEAAASVVGAVKYTAQTLTTEQKAQARTNIGAASPSDIPSGTVRYDTSQSLTDTQKTQAKANIGVPAIDATLAIVGATADAKKVGDEIADLKGDLNDTVKVTPQTLTDAQKAQARTNIGVTSDGLSNIAKEKLLLCLENASYKIPNGKDLYYDLYEVLYGEEHPDRLRYLVLDYKASRDGVLSGLTDEIAIYSSDRSLFTETISQAGNLRIQGNSSSDSSYLQFFFKNHPRILRGRLIIRGMMYKTSSSLIGAFGLRPKLASSNSKDALFGFGRNTSDSSICNVYASKGGSLQVIKVGEISTGENWHNFDLSFDDSNNRMELTVDGTKIYEGEASNHTPNSGSSIMIIGDCTVFIDTIKFYVYEE